MAAGEPDDQRAGPAPRPQRRPCEAPSGPGTASARSPPPPRLQQPQRIGQQQLRGQLVGLVLIGLAFARPRRNAPRRMPITAATISSISVSRRGD
jgi:hypothetical protein